MNIAVDAYGGLEHDNCTVLMAKRNAMRQRDSYLEWLGLVSHEFFHTWNVRRLRPKALMKYDYHREQYINELWIAEGITSYYDDLILVHAGLITEAEYLDQLSKTLRVVEDAPGQLVQTLNDSSYDAWIKHYRPDENTPNARVSYYTKGAAVAFVLDQLLRERTNNRKSLDVVMRQLWCDYRKIGYELADFEKIVSGLLGDSLREWFQEHIYSANKINYESALDRLGLTMQPPQESKPNDTPQPVGAWTASQPFQPPSAPEIDFGFDLVARDGRWIVVKVTRGGAAWEAGLQVDDELIALGGYRIPAANWRERMNEFRVQQKISTTIARRGKILERSIVCRLKKMVSLQSMFNPTQIQLDNRRRWLGTGTLDLKKFT
jgi:predicted metalloprotease with PDZ domain